LLSLTKAFAGSSPANLLRHVNFRRLGVVVINAGLPQRARAAELRGGSSIGAMCSA